MFARAGMPLRGTSVLRHLPEVRAALPVPERPVHEQVRHGAKDAPRHDGVERRDERLKGDAVRWN